MGSSSPSFLVNKEIDTITNNQIILPFLKHLWKLGLDYKGIIYLGAIYLPNRGKVYVVEWNARWGDPEAQVIVPGITNDFYEMGQAVASGNLKRVDITTDGKYRIAVAAVVKGYPYDHQRVRGKEIFGIDDAMKMDGITIYGAGVAKVDGRYYVNGGRLFYVVGEGSNPIEVRGKVYEAMKRIRVEGDNLRYRTDTGLKDAERFQDENR